MRIKPLGDSQLHKTRKRELDIVFQNYPKKLFETGLEIGAGDGFQATLLLNYVSNLVCTDYYPRFEKKEIKQISYLVCDAECIGNIFHEKQFDFVFSSNLLEHLPNPQKALKGIHSVLKDDGITIHVIPSTFWSLSHLVFYFPDRLITAFERLTDEGGFNRLLKKIKLKFQKNSEPDCQEQGFSINPKIKEIRRSFPFSWILPTPHGVSSNLIEEFQLFRKSRWEKEFEKADFKLLAVLKGPVSSGYRFGLDTLRHFLERIGFTSEYIYLAIKKGESSKYEKYFRFT
ncbi:MAG: class I SAM-dependent methyltransferase [Candidatus Altiarchaeota archaeon]